MAQRQGYGLDPAAQQITGAANTVMQGLSNWQQMQAQEEDREWTREQRERQREKWKTEEEVNEILTKALPPSTGQSEPARRTPPLGGLSGAAKSDAGTPEMALQDVSAAPQDFSVGQQPQVAPRRQGLGGTQLTGGQQSQESRPRAQGGQTPWGEIDLRRVEDLDQYSPEAINIARSQVLDLQTKQLRNSTAFAKHQREKAIQNRQQGMEKLALAQSALEAGEKSRAARIMEDVYNKHFWDGKVAQVDADGKARLENYLTGEKGEFANAQNVDELQQGLNDLTAIFSDPEAYMENHIQNRITQQEMQKEAIENAQPVVNPDTGDVAYKVAMPNSDTGMQDIIYFEDIPMGLNDDRIRNQERLRQIQDNYVSRDAFDIQSDIKDKQQKGQEETGEYVEVEGIGRIKRNEARQSLKDIGKQLEEEDEGFSAMFADVDAIEAMQNNETKDTVIDRITRLAKDGQGNTQRYAQQFLNLSESLGFMAPQESRGPQAQQGNQIRQRVSQETPPKIIKQGKDKETGKTVYKLEDGRNVYAEQYEQRWGR